MVWKRRCALGPEIARHDLCERADIKDWPANALRRSFASHNYATYKDAMETARIVGHIDGERTLFKYYIVYVPEKTAKQFWLMRPPVSVANGKLAA